MAYPTPSYAPPIPAPQDSRVIQELSAPIFQARGWLKFLGVMSIIGGVVQVLSIVGIINGGLSIWMGVLLFQTGSSVESASQFGDRFGFMNSLNNLKTYFIVQGVLTLIAIILVVSAICIVFVLPLLGLSLFSIPSISNMITGY